MVPRPGYRSSNIGPDLVPQVEAAVALHGYKSFDELVNEAVEEKLKRLRRKK